MDDQQIADLEGWFTSTVDRLAGSTPVADRADLVNEARLTFWTEHGKVDLAEPNRTWVALHKAKLRVKALAWRGEKPTGGAPGMRYEVTHGPSLDTPITHDTTFGDLVGGSEEYLDGVEFAYHRGELADALSALDPEDRRYVELRFWEGYSDTEVARILGLSTSGMHNRWTRRIRPALLERLSHLEAA